MSNVNGMAAPLSASISGGAGQSAVSLAATAAILARVAGRGGPRQPERIVVVAGDHVQMKVEHGLPGGRTGALDDVDAGRSEPLADEPGHPLGEQDAGREVGGLDLEEVRYVRPREDEEMARRRGVDVHQSDRAPALRDVGARQVAGQDPAEDARVGHGQQRIHRTDRRPDRFLTRPHVACRTTPAAALLRLQACSGQHARGAGPRRRS
jgi:hypothetical protein